MENYSHGLLISATTLAVTVFAEVICCRHAYGVIREYGAMTYAKALSLNVMNNGIIGPVVYAAVDFLWLNDRSERAPALELVMILGMQSVLYYAAHLAMHARFREMHEFHHTFASHVCPMVANAVSVYEYLFAYVFPFCVAGWLLRPAKISFALAVLAVSFFNILIHAPILEKASRALPRVLVTPSDHLRHHKTRRGTYAAPTLNVDFLLSQLSLRRRKR